MFKPTNPDFVLSPYTGMTRKHWIEAGKYLLEGVFKNIPSMDAPVVLPRNEAEITYPHKNAFGDRLKVEQMAEIFEGLTRTMFIAAPLIHIDPKIKIAGYSLKDYYSKQILSSCTKGCTNFVGYFEDLKKLCGGDDFSTFQQTVETCALVICLDICKEEIWDKYTDTQRDDVAKFLLSYAHESTVPQNWRLFNMLVMAFLHKEGYEIEKNVMSEHASVILGYYAGDGWYRDGQSFDYYSCWAFNVYTNIWNTWYGYENLPYIAKRFEENSNKLMKTFPNMFDRDGFTVMWGRSCVYRCAATSPLSENFLLKSPAADPGLARRIASGALLQFFGRDDFLLNGIPSMGFYGQFSPLIQGYSCTESAYWLGKAFLCLNLPEDHPFWTVKENNGDWDKLQKNEVKETVLNGPALCFTNHNANGETVFRTGKVVKAPGDIHGMWNYSKLSYNSKYPWEAAPVKDVESMQYVLTDDNGLSQRCNATFWCGSRGGVLYRRQFFDYTLNCETHWQQALNLADFPVEYGILRADKLRLFKTPINLTLGAYGFPDNGIKLNTETNTKICTEIIRKTEGKAKAVILKGHDHTGNPKQLAMTIYDGWDELELAYGRGTNPDSEKSIVIYAKTRRSVKYGYENFILISQVITKENHEDFSEGEIFPIKEVRYSDKERKGGYGKIDIILKNGSEKIVDFEGIEGDMRL